MMAHTWNNHKMKTSQGYTERRYPTEAEQKLTSKQGKYSIHEAKYFLFNDFTNKYRKKSRPSAPGCFLSSIFIR